MITTPPPPTVTASSLPPAADPLAAAVYAWDDARIAFDAAWRAWTRDPHAPGAKAALDYADETKKQRWAAMLAAIRATRGA